MLLLRLGNLAAAPTAWLSNAERMIEILFLRNGHEHEM
jgi:hypothetical protein